MKLTEEGKIFLENLNIYKNHKFNNLVTISGIEILRDNKILPVCTLYIKDDKDNLIFLADYCSIDDVKKLKEEISKEIDIETDKNLSIEEPSDKSNSQEMTKRLAYADPDIRPVLFEGKAIVKNSKITIKEDMLLLDGEESSVQDFVSKLFSEKDSPEKKILLSQEITRKKNVLAQLLENLNTMDNLIKKEGVVPKVIDVDGIETSAILFREKGKYKAFSLEGKDSKVIAKFEIKGDLSWEKTFELMSKEYSFSNDSEVKVEKQEIKDNSLEV